MNKLPEASSWIFPRSGGNSNRVNRIAKIFPTAEPRALRSDDEPKPSQQPSVKDIEQKFAEMAVRLSIQASENNS